MTNGADDPDTERLSPDEAFAVLGDETRLAILQELGQAADPLSFSELRARVGYDDPGNFQYHLNKLRGHFIRHTEDGYDLGEPGIQLVQAVESGAVTETPHIDATRIDWPCPYCGGTVTISYADSDDTGKHPVSIVCSDCPGLQAQASYFESGQISDIPFPPSGLRGRAPEDVVKAAITWDHFEMLGTYYGVCPHCQAVIERSVDVCEDHDPTGRCKSCDRTYAVELHCECTNCLFDLGPLGAVSGTFRNVELLSFLIEHDVNPFTDPWGPITMNANEKVLSTDPLLVRFTYSIDGNSLALTVDETLSVVEATRHASTESD